MTKKNITTAALVTVLGLGIIGVTTASAQSTSDTQNPMSSLVQKIAQRFNLKQSDVQAVFDEAHKEHHAEMKARSEALLSQYVSEGKITEAQKQLILKKQSELESSREANMQEMQNLTPEERKSRKEADRAALKAWAKENGIDMQYLMPHGKFRGVFKGHGMGFEKVPMTNVTPSVTQ